VAIAGGREVMQEAEVHIYCLIGYMSGTNKDLQKVLIG
jgi:hypothetical protein